MITSTLLAVRGYAGAPAASVLLRSDTIVTGEHSFKAEMGPTLFPDWNTHSPYSASRTTSRPLAEALRCLEDERSFVTPVNGIYVRGFAGRHAGLDIALRMGDSIRAAWSGMVRYAARDNGGYGNLVVIRHFNGFETWYAHLSEILVGPDQIVEASDIIGRGGSTGRSSGPHLHFETRYAGRPVDPLMVLKANCSRYLFSTGRPIP